MHNIQIAASQIVHHVIVNGRNLNQVLDESLRQKSVWLPAQRSALKDLSYGTLRYFGQLDGLLSLLLNNPLSDDRIRYLLLVALYQLQYSKAAKHAVVDHAVRSAQMQHVKVSGLVNGVLRNFLRNQTELLQQVMLRDVARHNHQNWWISELKMQYGEMSTDILAIGNQHPPMTLRVNQKRGSVDTYVAALEAQNITIARIDPDAILLDKPVGVDKLPGFLTGAVSVQDAGAQYAAGLLDLSAGMHVLDACSAPGGKAAHILEQADVSLLALDKDEIRLQRVSENLRRLGLSASVKVGDAMHPKTWWDGILFDRILADVPCSASGVVRRHPDIKWLRRRADIGGFANQQLEIVHALWQVLANNGKLLYATCSVFNQENEQVIEKFLSQCPSASRLPVILPNQSQGQLLPNDQHDGFFYALLQKNS